MATEAKCPKCNSENIYADGNMWICPECSHEWSQFTEAAAPEAPASDNLVKDAHGNVLADGDSVVVLKDLKMKGSNGVVKGGIKVRNIRLYDAGDGHNITCKIDGLGAINLKSEYVKKV